MSATLFRNVSLLFQFVNSIVANMGVHPVIQKITRLFLIAGILTNVLICLAFVLFGQKVNSQYLYLPIYALLYCVFPALLVLLFLFIKGLVKEGFSKTMDLLQSDFLLAFISIFTFLGLRIYSFYFIG